MATYGTAEVRIEADTSDFHRDLERRLRGETAQVSITPDRRGLIRQIRRDIGRMTEEIRLRADSRRLVREVERDLAQIHAPQVDVDVQADTSRAESQLRSLDADDVRIQVTADTNRAEQQIHGLVGETHTPVTVPVSTTGAAEAGSSAGSGILSGITEALGGAGPWGAVAAAATAGAAVVAAAFVEGFQGAIETQQIAGQFEAQLGATSAEAERYGRLAGDLYAHGVTETVQEGAQAVQEAVRAGLQLNPGDLDLRGVSTELADLSNILEEDVGQTARAVGQMIKTGLVDNAQEGFDLLTKGAQEGANAADDLLDTFSEYSTQFRQLGLSGQEALGLIQQGLRGGARDSDVVADALKEFSIEAAQGGQRVMQAFKGLNLDAGRLSSAFAEGGPAAHKALQQVLDSLRDIEDPLQRNQIAVGLFGTKAEDLAGALNAMDLDTAAKQMKGFEGATQRAGDGLRDNLGTALTRVGREAKQAFVGLFSGDLTQFADLGDAIRDAIPYVREAATTMMEAFGNAIEEYGPRIPAIIFRLGKKIGESIDQWGPMLLKGMGFLTLLPLAIVTALAFGLAGVLSGLWEKVLPYLEAGWDAVKGFFTDTIPSFLAGIGDTIASALGAAWQAAWNFVTDQLPQYAQGVLNFFASLPGKIFYGLGALAGMLVSAFVSAFTYLWKNIPVWFEATVTFFRELPGRILSGLVSLGSKLWNAFLSAVNFVVTSLPGAIDRVIDFFRRLPGQAVSALSGFASRVSRMLVSAMSTVAARVNTKIHDIVGFFRALPGQIRSALSSIGSSVWNGLKSVLNAGIRLVNRAISGFNRFSPVNVSKIPELANGAIVTAPTTALIGEAGPEAVIPLMRHRRAGQLAEQSGLIDILERQGLVVRADGGDRSQHHTWNITTRGTDPRTVSQAMYNRMTLATGV